MNVRDHIHYWLKTAEHDLSSANALFKNFKYDWCLFLRHLVLEKTLKALWVKNNENKAPPKTHNLVKLVEESRIQMTDEMKLQLLNINDFNIETRYPDYKLNYYKKCNKKFTERNFKIIKELYLWIKGQI